MRHDIGLGVVLGGVVALGSVGLGACGFRANAVPDSGAPPAIDASIDDAGTGSNTGSDGGTADAMPAPGCLQHWLDGNPTVSMPDELTELETTGGEERDPWLSQDGTRLYYAHDPGSQGMNDLFLASRATASGPFGNTKDLVNVSSTQQDARPALTMDEKTLVFSSDRPSGDAFDIVIVSRDTGNFGDFATPTQAEQMALTSVNAMGTNHYDPFLSPDGTRLYLAPDIGPSSRQQLVVATRGGNGTYGTPAQLGGINAADLDTADPALVYNERILVYSAFKNGQDVELWYAVRPNATAAFATPAKIPVVNSGSDEGDPMLSDDGCDLYFTSNRDTDHKFHVFHAHVTK